MRLYNKQVALDFQGAAVATWWNGQQLFQQPQPDGGDPWHMAVNPAGVTGRGSVLHDTAGEPIRGATFWASNQHSWLKYLAGTTPQCTGSPGQPRIAAFVGDVASQAPVAVTVDLDGLACTTWRTQPDGGTTPVGGFIRHQPLSNVRLSPSGTYACWAVPNGIAVVNAVTGAPQGVQHLPGQVAWPIVFEDSSSRVWVAYWSGHTQSGVCHRADDASRGYKLDATTFSPDFEPHGAGGTLGWCIDEGQFKPQLLEIPILGDNMTVFDSVTQPPQPVPVLGAWPRKMWVSAFFSYSLRPYGHTDDPLGNAQTLVGDEPDKTMIAREVAEFSQLGQPLFVAAGDAATDPTGSLNTTIAWWASGADIDGLASAVAVCATRPEKPIIVYLDKRGWPSDRPSWVTEQVWPSVQVYRQPGETLADFAQRAEDDVRRVHNYGRPFFLTLRMDDYNGQTSEQFVLDCMPVYERLARQYNVVGLHLFADRRGNGMAKLPALRAWGKAFAQAAERPSRYDYWQSDTVDPVFVLTEKLKQSTANIALTPDEKARLLALLGAAGPIPPQPPLPPGPLPEPPNLLSLVQAQWQAQPPDGTHDGNLAFCRRVAQAAAAQDPRWGLNWKRGNVGVPSVDILSYRWGPSDRDCRIVDIIYASDDPADPGFGPVWGVHSVEHAGEVLWYKA